MIRLLLPLLAGFGIDCLLGDPHGLPHPVVLIGKTISALERVLRKMFPKTPRGERAAGAGLHGFHRAGDAGVDGCGNKSAGFADPLSNFYPN